MKDEGVKNFTVSLFLLSQLLNTGILLPHLQISSYSFQALSGSAALMLMVMAKTINETHNRFCEKEIIGVWKCKINEAVSPLNMELRFKSVTACDGTGDHQPMKAAIPTASVRASWRCPSTTVTSLHSRCRAHQTDKHRPFSGPALPRKLHTNSFSLINSRCQVELREVRWMERGKADDKQLSHVFRRVEGRQEEKNIIGPPRELVQRGRRCNV